MYVLTALIERPPMPDTDLKTDNQTAMDIAEEITKHGGQWAAADRIVIFYLLSRIRDDLEVRGIVRDWMQRVDLIPWTEKRQDE